LSCAAWVTDHRSGTPESKSDESWVLGYFSGWNTWGKHRPHLTWFFSYDEANIVKFIDQYCAGNPNGSIAQAAQSLIDGQALGLDRHEMEMRKRQAPSP